MNRDELDKLQIVGTADLALWDMGQTPPRMIVAPGAIDPAYFNVLRAVSVAHVALKATLDTLDALSQAADEAGLANFAPAIDACATNAVLARRVACEGVEAVTAAIKGIARNG